MHIEFTHCPGKLAVPDGSQAKSFFFDPREAARKLQAIEQAGFGRIIVDDDAGLLSNMDIAAQVIHDTSAAGVELTHWAGFVEPATAARQIAMLDRMSGGRLSLRVLPGLEGSGNTDALGHVNALQMTDEYLTLLKRLWLNDVPFDHEGPFYSIRGGYAAYRRPQGEPIAFRMGGRSGTSLKVAGRHADVFELFAGSHGELARTIERVRAASAEVGRVRKIRFALPVRLNFASASNAGWVAIPDAQAARISGTPAQIVVALLGYADLGVSEFVLHGLDSLHAIRLFGETVAPVLRNSLARRHGLDPIHADGAQSQLWAGRPHA